MLSTDLPLLLPRAQELMRERGLALLDALREAARERDARPPQPGPIPHPADFLAALGYFGDARLVSVHAWGDGDVWVTDGHSSVTGDRAYFHAYIEAAPIRPYLRGADLHRTHRLILDTERDTLLVLPSDQARAVLAAQYGKMPLDLADAEPPPALASDALRAVLDLDTWEEVEPSTTAKAQAALGAATARYEALRAWLAEQPIPEAPDPGQLAALIADVRADLGLTSASSGQQS